jgi:hypothetical protein
VLWTIYVHQRQLKHTEPKRLAKQTCGLRHGFNPRPNPPEGGVPSFTLFLTGLSCVGSFLASCWERWLGTVRWWWWWWWWWWAGCSWGCCWDCGGHARLCWLLLWWCMDFDTPRLLVHDPFAFTTAADGWWLEWWSTSEGSYTSVVTSTGKTGRCSWNDVPRY